MTNNGSSKTLKTKFVLVLTVLCLVISCIFGFTACKKSVSVTDPTYSYTEPTVENEDEIIKNQSFSLGSDSTKDDAFPVTSATGWTKASDNSAASSAVNSGIVKLTADSWRSTVKTLYADSDFESYLKKLPDGKSKTDIDDAIKAEKGESYSVTDDDRAEYIIANNLFSMPEKHAGENVDDYVYMLNNMRTESYSGLGTAQKLTSSTSVTVEKGKIYKISVWVKTVNVKGTGANIRLVNSVGGVSQSDFRISNIKTATTADNGGWEQFAVYVKADAAYDCTVTLVLGLGYGKGSSDSTIDYAEGTVFFDDVKVEKDVAAIPAGATSYSLAFGSTDKTEATTADVDGVKSCAYDMKVDTGATAYSTALNEEFTKSNVTAPGAGGVYEEITSKTYNSASTFEKTNEGAGVYKFSLNQASGTVKLTDAPETVAAGKYVYLSFNIKIQLDKLGSTAVSLLIVDSPNSAKPIKTYTAVSAAEDDEWTLVSVIVKNNFETGDRKFDAYLVIGPTDVSAVKYNADFATGDVYVKDFNVKTGKTDKEDYVVTNVYEDGADNPEYKLYNSLLSAKANATVALYAGNAADYSEPSESENYSLTYAPGNIGCIETAPTAVKGYYGIIAGHAFVSEDIPETEDKKYFETNTRTGKTGDEHGNFAGLINTKYLSNYSGITALSEIQTQLGAYGDDDIQPIMIYNGTEDSYGFIGENQTVAASAYASVSVTLKAAGNAKAYVYLVNTSDKAKSVLTFSDFNVNTEIGKTANGTAFNGADHKLAFTVDKNTESDENGWVTVTFYVAAGADAIDFRVEVWNGDRTATNKSQGYVFVKDINVTTSSAFSEPSSWANAFSTSGNPLYDAKSIYLDELVGYKRVLTATEEKFNKEYPEQTVSYEPTYVWAKNDTMIYAVYNTVNPVVTDPYESIEDEETESGCTAKTDPSTFWLSFSSVLLGVVLVLAIIALVVKTVRRKRIANKSDAKTQYKVKSRIDSHRENQKLAAKKAKAAKVEETEETESDGTEPDKDEETADGATEETAPESAEEQNLDAYVYGEVQDFGDAETNEDKDGDK
ncbi:MAG: hypothetical protein SOT08_06240 [Candidatus Borkfalkiaceae bacterium]|nr:hypothetical protein [Christensenellaceae bacterium]